MPPLPPSSSRRGGRRSVGRRRGRRRSSRSSVGRRSSVVVGLRRGRARWFPWSCRLRRDRFRAGGGRVAAVVVAGDHDHGDDEADDHRDQAGDERGACCRAGGGRPDRRRLRAPSGGSGPRASYLLLRSENRVEDRRRCPRSRTRFAAAPRFPRGCCPRPPSGSPAGGRRRGVPRLGLSRSLPAPSSDRRRRRSGASAALDCGGRARDAAALRARRRLERRLASSSVGDQPLRPAAGSPPPARPGSRSASESEARRSATSRSASASSLVEVAACLLFGVVDHGHGRALGGLDDRARCARRRAGGERIAA